MAESDRSEMAGPAGGVGFTSRPIALACGTSSERSSRRLGISAAVSMDTPVRLLQGIVRAPLNDMAKPWVQTRDPSPNLPSERLPAGRIREMLRRFMVPKSFHAAVVRSRLPGGPPVRGQRPLASGGAEPVGPGP